MNNFKISHKHLNIEDRETIEKLLKENYSFKYIGYKLKKHQTTISKEIRNNKIRKMPSTFNYGFNFCAKRKDCTIQNLCVKKCHVSCSSCKSCNSLCKVFYCDARRSDQKR